MLPLSPGSPYFYFQSLICRGSAQAENVSNWNSGDTGICRCKSTFFSTEKISCFHWWMKLIRWSEVYGPKYAIIALPSSASPTLAYKSCPIFSIYIFHDSCSSPRPSMSFRAVSRSISVCFTCSYRFYFFYSDALNWSSSCFSFISIWCSSSCFILSAACISSDCFVSSSTSTILGLMIANISAYLSMARAHTHSTYAALLALPTLSGLKSGFLVYLRNWVRTFGGMLSLS